MVARVCNHSTRKSRTEDLLEVQVGYIMSSRPVWATIRPYLKTTTAKKIQTELSKQLEIPLLQANVQANEHPTAQEGTRLLSTQQAAPDHISGQLSEVKPNTAQNEY